MDTIGGNLIYLARRLGRLSTPLLLIVASVLMVATFVVAVVAADVLAAAAEPIVMAPFRW